MGPGQEGTWNKLKPPSHLTQGMQSGTTSGHGFKGSANMSSTEQPDKPEQAGGMKSAETNHAIGNGNVKRSGYSTPKADVRFTEGANNNMSNMTDAEGKY